MGGLCKHRFLIPAVSSNNKKSGSPLPFPPKISFQIAPRVRKGTPGSSIGKQAFNPHQQKEKQLTATRTGRKFLFQHPARRCPKKKESHTPKTVIPDTQIFLAMERKIRLWKSKAEGERDLLPSPVANIYKYGSQDRGEQPSPPRRLARLPRAPHRASRSLFLPTAPAAPSCLSRCRS